MVPQFPKSIIQTIVKNHIEQSCCFFCEKIPEEIQYQDSYMPILTVMVSVLFDSLLASRGQYHPLQILETTGRMTMKFLTDVKLNQEAGNQKTFVNYRQILKNPIFRNATSNHANFTKFCRTINLMSEINPENFRSISDLIQLVCKMRSRSRETTKFTE